jgi:hypothetical protein
MSIILNSYNVVGDCLNTSGGSFTFDFESTTYPITLNWNDSPIGYFREDFQFSELTSSHTFTGLTFGYYSFVLNTSPAIPQSLSVSFLITSSTTLNLESIKNTTCGNNNGILKSTMNYTTNTNSPFFNNDIIQAVNSFSATTYLYDKNGLVKTNTDSNPIFNNLSSGLYYAEYVDMCGCSSISNNVIVQSSKQLDFGLYGVSNSDCSQNKGKLIVTGLTGQAPYTYQWGGVFGTSGQTGSTVTGLSQGNYSLTVYDSNFCSKTVTETITTTPSLSFLTLETVQPNCYSSDGSITFYFSGGSAPYLYQLSNGQSQYSLSNQVTFTGLATGDYTCIVNDAGLCSARGNTTLQTPKSFSSIIVQKKDATCTSLGEIFVQYQSGTPPFTVSLSGSNYTGTTFNTNQYTVTFTGLIPNTYTMNITDSSNTCTYSSQVTIDNISFFTLSASTTGTTCGGSNGAVEISVLNPYKTGMTFTYDFNNQLSSSITATTYLYNNLSSGDYTFNVTDSESCTQSITASVSQSQSPIVIIQQTDETIGQSNGTIYAYIKSTEGPFDINWSSNVNGQTGIYLSGLSAGTYIMSLTSSTGCQLLRAINVNAVNPTTTATSYTFKYATGLKTDTFSNRLTLQNMFYSGYSGLIKSNIGENCVLSSATFYVDINIGGIDYEFPFYTTRDTNNIPNFNEFSEVVTNAVLSIPNIQSCTIDTERFTIDIVAKSNESNQYYKDESISFTIKIFFVITCVSINNVTC